MALEQNPANSLQHKVFHTEIHELLASMDSYINVGAYATLQAAHDALPAGGGTLWFPPGLELTPTAATTISKPCAIVGSPGSRLIQGGSGVYNLIDVTSAVDRFAVVNMNMDGRLDNGRAADGNLISLSAACNDVQIIGNRLLNCRGAFSTNGHTTAYTNVRIEQNRIVNSFYTGLYIWGQHNRLWIRDNYIEDTEGPGIFFENLTAGEQINVVVSGNMIVDPQRGGLAGQAGIQTFGSTSNRHRRFKIINNTVTQNTRGNSGAGDAVGIGLDQITDSLIEGNHVKNPDWGEGIITLGYGNDIVGNRCQGQSASGIGLLSYGGEQQITNVNVVGNICQGGASAVGNGITFVANAVAGQDLSGILIASNRCYGNNFGILSYNDGGTMTCADIFVVGNLLAGNTTAAQFVTTTGVTRTSNHPTI